MILTCPQCHTKYQLAEEQLKPNGRKVRCSRCRHVFWADSDGKISEVSTDLDIDQKEASSVKGENTSKENIFAFEDDRSEDLDQTEASKEGSGVKVVWIVVLILVIIGAGAYFGLKTGLLF